MVSELAGGDFFVAGLLAAVVCAGLTDPRVSLLGSVTSWRGGCGTRRAARLCEQIRTGGVGAIGVSGVVYGQVSCPALPLERICVEIEQPGPRVCRASASLQTDWRPVRDWRAAKLGMQPDGFGDVLHGALLSR
ncbi:hypothetical protein MSTO_18550 [Mycobacterium stomatepiae]|uniref:Uncharacterized protein n=1 Tax=Mycobacterium stomatepiae TaxID=470076 RepID=A0A7I7Q5K5_9MYCO|nr:hypothetical protein MSTO_18550 [Mycobacterium stomatepiae]